MKSHGADRAVAGLDEGGSHAKFAVRIKLKDMNWSSPLSGTTTKRPVRSNHARWDASRVVRA
jgi:hypothetical protein